MELTTQIAEQVVATASDAMQYEFAFTPDKFVESLPIMGTGMLGIFVVMGVIILCVSGLNALGNKPKKEKKNK